MAHISRVITARTTALPFLALLLWAAQLEACQVPVFRYALERWPAHPHELVPATGAAMPDLSAWPHANLSLRAPADDEAGQTWRVRPAWPLPRKPWWTGTSQPDLAALIDSPVRRALVDLLARQGATGVCLIAGPDAQEREMVRARFAQRAQLFASTATLPEEDPTTATSPQDLRDPTITTPYQIQFHTLDVASNDPQEAFLLAQFAGIADSDSSAVQAWIVYGRGRAIGPFTAEELDPATIDSTLSFLVSICSCQIKELNPGFDLLLNADWDQLIRQETTQSTKEAAPQTSSTAAQKAAPEQVVFSPQAASATPAHNQTNRAAAVAIVLGAALFVALLWLVYHKRSR